MPIPQVLSESVSHTIKPFFAFALLRKPIIGRPVTNPTHGPTTNGSNNVADASGVTPTSVLCGDPTKSARILSTTSPFSSKSARSFGDHQAMIDEITTYAAAVPVPMADDVETGAPSTAGERKAKSAHTQSTSTFSRPVHTGQATDNTTLLDASASSNQSAKKKRSLSKIGEVDGSDRPLKKAETALIGRS